MNIIHYLTETDIININVKSQLDHQIQIQEIKKVVGPLIKVNSMKLRLYKTDETNGSSYVKFPLRSFALKNIKIDDNFWFSWSILPELHPCNIDQSCQIIDNILVN